MNRIVNFLHVVFAPIGFDSLMELLKSTFFYKEKITTIYAIGFSVSTIIGVAEIIIEKYIYSPALGIAILWITTFFDVVLGLAASRSDNINIDPSKLNRAFIRLVVQTVITGLFFQMSIAWNHFVYSWMVDALLIIFTLSVFFSLIQNARKLDLITKDQFEFIQNIVNLKKLFNKISKRNGTPKL